MLSSSVVASIPSPSISSFQIGPLTIHFYALCILAGIVVAALMTNRRLTKRGAEPWVVIDIVLLAVPLALIGARLFHVFTHWAYYFDQGREWWNPFVKDAIWNIWDGGIAIFGALIGGAIGAWLGCKWTGIRFWTFADALAPGLLLAQALGRFGNWFNQELYGQPTDLPWGLQIDYPNAAWPAGLPEGTLFHPTFLYEVIWNTLGVIFLLWAGKRFTLQWGRLFALYLVWYSAGRIVWENIRIDPSEVILGLRTNVWAAIFGVVIGLVIFFVQKRRHPGFEPSPYQRGREWTGGKNVQSQNTDEFVDVSAPPTRDTITDTATSTVASN
ncbi:MAG: prolipoprotein diacylglyceryl transferase [Microbacterium sp. SCN 70-200]|uniref:prolipoprotein diacylglyceryl transferase n=1 Tax=unclassified Microbacterium TaxID=2609290 RepID=UPI00086996C7|nr:MULTISPECIES: prolipoprotein diacylglyceryl transferase [unclassified Microbacterium]MBN9214305.1 prolipoprotein diacylglyceryl transferase [Microbacterium sp.]ODT40951.1 MAG: prolipoprotein diacylglyceryl transferase [Microbacterium sp. SCN 70-200]OJV83878.1 MAG: prolipoprotein diacylglyceryl transferase [Microbacterium sp. 70-16]